jgi:diaminopimelate decarboxylase
MPDPDQFAFLDVRRHSLELSRLLSETPPPIFVGQRAIIAERFSRLQSALARVWPSHAIAYSFKTNYQVAQSGLLKNLGAWAEVVSRRECRAAQVLGFEGAKIIFNGPWKTDDALHFALAQGAMVNVNDGEELARLEQIATSMSWRFPIGIRVNMAIDGLPRSRFGFSIDDGEAAEAIATIRHSGSLSLAGLHMHLGGEIDDPKHYADACRGLSGLVRQLPADERVAIAYIDVGGGFPSDASMSYRHTTRDPRPINEYIEAIVAVLCETFNETKKPRLIVEPGRYLVNDGIALVSQVISVRRSGETQAITCNATISMLPAVTQRPAAIRPYSKDLRPLDTPLRPSQVLGASCREDDLLFKGDLPSVTPGDYLVHYGVGAYNSSLSPNFIFATPPLRFLG